MTQAAPPTRADAPKPRFAPLPRQPAYQRVSSVIAGEILQRNLRQGDALPTETELAQQFAVNRSTIREALRRLESDGLIARQNGGKRLFVRKPDQTETAVRVGQTLALGDVTFAELWEAMLTIAPRTAALAATRASMEQITQLAGITAALELAHDSQTAVAAVVSFFDSLATFSGNPVLVLAMQPVSQLLAPSLRAVIDKVPQARQRIVVAQHAILELLLARNAAETEVWMERHVQDFRRGFELAGITLATRVGNPLA